MPRFFPVMLSLLVITGLPVNVGGVFSLMTVQNGGRWGDWGDIVMCPMGMYAAGFSLKVEASLGANGDDTALNGIRLYCAYPSKASDYFISSNEGSWGKWTDVKKCTSGFLTLFKLRVEPPQYGLDDTAANNIRFKCGQEELAGDGTDWGNWGQWSSACNGKGICGLQTKIEGPQGPGDDTALNDMRMFCCD